jgi:hypothetical protein
LNLIPDAIAVEEAVIAREPHDTETLYSLQVHYRRQSRYADAHRAVKQILAVNPTHAGALRVLPYLEGNLRHE